MATQDDLEPLVREALLACRLFAGLDASGMALIAGALRTRRFRRGEVIFHAGDPGDSLSIVRLGSVKILVAPEDGAEPAILTTVGPGGFFGELALLDGGVAVGHGGGGRGDRDPRPPPGRVRSTARRERRDPPGPADGAGR